MFLQIIKEITIKKIFSKKNIIIFVLVAWSVFSVWYVVRDQWWKFQYRQLQAAYQKGSADTIRLLMEQAERCIKIPMQDGDKKIEVMKVGCFAPEIQKTPEKNATTSTSKP